MIRQIIGDPATRTKACGKYLLLVFAWRSPAHRTAPSAHAGGISANGTSNHC